MRRILLVTLLLVVVAPQAAHAGTVSLGSVATDPKYGYEEAVLSFEAMPGERNRIVVAKVDSNRPPTLVLRDEGALLQAGRGCTAIDANTASCVANYVSVDAGDGDDTVTLAPGVGDDQYGHYSPYVRGGDGADVLTGTGELLGGPGNDTLTCPEPCAGSLLAGGAGDDVLRGGNAADRLSGDGDGPAFIDVIDLELTESGPGGDDRIDGGGGRDRLSFEGRASGVRADLAAGTATGAGGEQDGLAGIEDVIGGDGDDMLLGDAAANQLEGDAGDDRISGRAGDDYLLGDLVPVDNEYSVDYTRGSDGSDTLHGDAGDDVLDAGGERGDALSGGPGDDTLQNGLYGPTRARSVRCANGRDTIRFVPQGQMLSGCESLGSAYPLRMALRPRVRSGGRLRFDWGCKGGPVCVMGVGVRVGSSKLVRRRLSLGGRKRASFLIRPARAARRGDVADVTIIIRADSTNQAYSARWRVVL